MTKYYFNFTESEFENAPEYTNIKARTCIECENYQQVEELQRNAAWQNHKAGYKMYKRFTVTYKPIRNAYYSTYAEYTRLHDKAL